MRVILVGVIFLFMLPIAYAENNVDIQHYDFHINLLPQEHKFTAKISLEIKALGDIDKVAFFLNKDLSISRITDSKSRPLHFERHDNKIEVTLEKTLKNGTLETLTFEYSGISDTNFQSGKFIWGYIGREGSYMIYESVWYPLIWGDRATARISLTVPEDETAVTVGELVEVLKENAYKTFVWDIKNPTRGISFASGKYLQAKREIFIQNCPHKFLEVEYYLYPEEYFRAEKSFKLSSDIIEFYSSAFGCYPFQKFSVVEIPEFFYGGHGDQGLIMLSAGIFRKEPSPEFIAHEIAHNWWGALVFAKGEPSLRSIEKFSMILTPPKPEIEESPTEQHYWLLEGFATYSGAMFLEDKYGRDALISALEKKRKEYLDKVTELGDLPITRVEEEYGGGIYHAVVYSKGALVLHMLRYVVGDNTFKSIMESFASQYSGKSSSVEDFQKVSERVSGKDLSWFFKQWVYGTNLPDYKVESAITKGHSVIVKIAQVGDITEMPIDVTLYTADGEITKKVWMRNLKEQVSFETEAKPEYIKIDKDHWILESDRSNNIYTISYPLNIEGIKLFFHQIFSLL